MKQIIGKTSTLPHEDYKEFYNETRKYFHHQDHKGKKIKPDREKVQKLFGEIDKIKKEIVKLEFYREIMQDFGDNIRSTGNPYIYLNFLTKLDEKEKRKKIRMNYRSLAKDLDYLIHYLMNLGVNFFAVDCFRNPNTAKYFREKYSKFYLISLFSNAKDRLKRLVDKESKRKNSEFSPDAYEKEFNKWDKRDKGDELPLEQKLYEQNVTETALISDIAINNEGSKEDLWLKLIRNLGLIFDPGCTKPTSQEMFMNLAYTMSMKSNCISRQVGAVIVGKEGYVVGAGWNDVGEGQISCGLRNIRDLHLPTSTTYINALDSEKRRIIDTLYGEWNNKAHFCFCFKDEMSAKKVKIKLGKITNDFFSSQGDKLKEDGKKLCRDLVDSIEKDLDIKRLEYCKALHAEENAIIQGAKIGGMGLKDAVIYVTSFPCELCAKKIYQSGIKEVVYTEPYPGTISKEVYLEDGVLKVNSRQFEGVKPFGYFQLFKPFPEQKEWQRLNILELVD
jgi:deoxycytidylate deaminase